MDQVELQQKIAEYYAKLPPKAQESFSAMKWLDTLRTISQKYDLNENQIQSLGTETTLALLGIINMTEYEKNLVDELKLSKDKENDLLDEINTFILNPIRPELAQSYTANISELKEISNTAKISNEQNTVNDIVQKMDPRFKTLPPELQEIIKNSEYQSKLYEVGKENGLTIAQISKLEEIITNTILGTIHPEDFENKLSLSLNLPPEKNKTITNAINDRVLKEIRIALMNTYKKENIKISNEEDIILKNAGFDIENEVKIEERDVVSESESEMQKDISNTSLIKTTTNTITTPKIEKTPSIMEQKMKGSYSLPSTSTVYDASALTTKEDSKPQISSIKKDPYRLSPDE